MSGSILHPSTGGEQPERQSASEIALVRRLRSARSWHDVDRDIYLAADAIERWERLARMEHATSGRWQEMAEDLWEELQEWHDDECSHGRPSAPLDECTCHRILATKWDEITNAADWADDEDETA